MSSPSPPDESPLVGGKTDENAASRRPVVVGVFGKHWTPGATKTRLAAGVGPELAAAASRCFLETTLDRLAGLPIAAELRLEHSPPGLESEFAALPQVAQGGWDLRPQTEGDLGTRMRAYFERALASADAAVLVGSDSPHLPLAEVGAACEWLTEAETPRSVFGPTKDGGYWLIGASNALPRVFEGMPWSEPGLLEATTARLENEGADYRLLRTWYDVDDLDDLTRLRRELADENDADLVRLATRLNDLFGPLPSDP